MPHALVVGTGPLVRDLVARLTASGRDVVAVPAAEIEEHAAANVRGADVVLAVDDDDATNLATALRARQIDPHVRLVISQFDRTIAAELETVLGNCGVVSLASLSAATYAAIALDPSIVGGVEFPDGRLVGVAARRGAEVGAPGRRRALEARGGVRVLCYAGAVLEDGDDPEIDAGDELVVAGPIALVAAERRRPGSALVRRLTAGPRALAEELDTLFVGLATIATAVTALATLVFSRGLGLDPLSALYFAVTTLTTTGYGDVSLLHAPAPMKVAGIVLMIIGVTLVNVTIAFLATAFVRAQWTVVQGMRSVHTRGHVVVCGSGRVGTRVMEFLRAYGVHVVVVDVAPAASLVRLAKRGRIDVITGDATVPGVLAGASVASARALVVSTDRDAANVEVALAGRAQRADLPVVMRIGQPRFARAAADQLGLRRTRSPLDVAVPVIAALADDPTIRSEVEVGATSFVFRVVEAAGANGTVVTRDGDRALVAVPVRGPGRMPA